MSKFCKICYDAGKSDYLKHNIREWNQNRKCHEVVCPYLKNLTCSNCGEKAHTSRYCKQVKQIPVVMTPVCLVKPVKVVKEVPKIITNMFDLLKECDENCEEVCGQEYEKEITIKTKKIEYTMDGECLGTVDDIIWGYGFKDTIYTSWAMNCVY
jgi:hypothetical protein